MPSEKMDILESKVFEWMIKKKERMDVFLTIQDNLTTCWNIWMFFEKSQKIWQKKIFAKFFLEIINHFD